LGSQRRLAHRRDNDVDLKPDQLLRKSEQLLKFTFREPALDDDGLSLDIAELLQPLPERLIARLGPCGRQIADARDFFRLLCARRKWPCGHSAKQRDELAPFHRLTPRPRIAD